MAEEAALEVVDPNTAAAAAAVDMDVENVEAGGNGAERLAGRHLTGAVIGSRVRTQGFSLEVFAGAPLWQPSRFPEARVVAGFNLSYSL